MTSTRSKLLALALLLAPSIAVAQNNLVPVPPTFKGPALFPQLVAGATITFCTSTATGAPCSPLAQAYSDSTNSLPINQAINPLKTDALGNAPVFYAAPGQYSYTLTGAAIGSPQGPYQITVPCVPGTTCVATSANNAFTGNNSHSGTETFTGAITCTIFNAVRCVSPSNPQLWAGSDVGAWINSAYANCAAAGLTTCPIQMAAGAYTTATLFNFSTLNVYPQLQCVPGGGTTITFSATSGTAITLNPGRAGLPIDWGISGCKFVGSGLGNTLTGILSGGTNGAVGAALRGIQMTGFNIALTFGTNVQGWLLDHSTIGDNNQNMVVPAGQTQTGEGMTISNSTLSQSTNLTWSATCISFGNAGATIYDFSFVGDQMDSCGVTQGTGSVITTFRLHQENPQNVTIGGGAYWIVNGGVVSHISPNWTSEQTLTPTYFLDCQTAGAICNVTGMNAINNGGASMTAVHICATCQGTMTGNLNVSGTASITDALIDTGGILARLSKGSFSLAGGGTGGPFEIRPNTGQTISGCTGDMGGILQSGVAHLVEFGSSSGGAPCLGVGGFIGATNAKLSGTVQDQAGHIMGLTLKKGSGAGNYTNATTTYAVADSANLCFTVTIPTGWKLGVSVSGALSTATAAVVAQAALTDNAACATANAGILVETAPIQGAGIGIADAFSLDWVITGDGNAHNIALQFKTSNASDTASLINSSATILPTMKFELMPSN